MKIKIPFINIHKHSESDQGEIAIKNVLLDKFISAGNFINQHLSVGFHPWRVTSQTLVNEVKKGLEISASSKYVLTLGETGLDRTASNPFEYQVKFFKAHIEVSESSYKPLIIHCVRAHQEILAIRKELKARQTWIFHGFNGSPQMAMQILSQGCMISFGKAILGQGNRATHSLFHLQPEQFFLETDDSTHPICTIYEMASRIKQLTMEELSGRLHGNFLRLFGK